MLAITPREPALSGIGQSTLSSVPVFWSERRESNPFFDLGEVACSLYNTFTRRQRPALAGRANRLPVRRARTGPAKKKPLLV